MGAAAASRCSRAGNRMAVRASRGGGFIVHRCIAGSCVNDGIVSAARAPVSFLVLNIMGMRTATCSGKRAACMTVAGDLGGGKRNC